MLKLAEEPKDPEPDDGNEEGVKARGLWDALSDELKDQFDDIPDEVKEEVWKREPSCSYKSE